MSVSVVIPTLNEEACLRDTLLAVRRMQPLEIIVADGGSTDQTRSAAATADRWLDATRGRAQQMNAGARAARGDILLFLHADCTLENGSLVTVEECLKRRNVAAGCFRQTSCVGEWESERVRAHSRSVSPTLSLSHSPTSRLLYRCIDASASARVRLTGLAYGDQGLFVRRETFERIGGFPEVALMEDVFICRRLRQLGRIVVAAKRIFVSPRRWQRQGIVRQTLRNWALTALAAAGVSPNSLARFYPVVR